MKSLALVYVKFKVPNNSAAALFTNKEIGMARKEDEKCLYLRRAKMKLDVYKTHLEGSKE